MNGKLKILTSMAIFGTVGIFVRFIPMASAAIAFCRGVLGCVFLLLLMKLGILPTPAYLQSVLGTEPVSEQTGEVRKSAIPDFSAIPASSLSVYSCSSRK